MKSALKKFVKSNPALLSLVGRLRASAVEAKFKKREKTRKQIWKDRAATGETSRTKGVPNWIAKDVIQIMGREGHSATYNFKLSRPTEVVKMAVPVSVEELPYWPFGKFKEGIDQARYTFELPKGRIYTESAAIITKDDVLLHAESFDYSQDDPWRWKIFAQDHLPPVTHQAGMVGVGISQYDGNIYHCLTEALPRILLLREHGYEEKLDKWLVRGKQPKFLAEAYELIGVPTTKMIYANDIAHLEADVLVSSTRPGIFNVERGAVESVRAAIAQKVQPSQSGRKLYISRSTARYRKLLNEDEIWPKLEAMGFEKILMEQFSLAEQIRLMMEAEIVVGLHGANLACSMFCQPGTKLIEIFPRCYVLPCYWQIASHAGLTYGAMLGEDNVGPLNPDRQHYSTYDTTIRWEKLAELLTKMS